MDLLDIGSGPPLVVIPGVQGRWEWMRPGIEALARRCRVVTFSLANPPAESGRADAATGLSYYVTQVHEAMDAAGLERAVICGVSYGGLIAAAFASRHPDRVASLVLVSAIPPSWRPNRRTRFYLRAPRLLVPVFCVSSLRLYAEIAAASPTGAAAIGAAARHVWRVLTHPFSPTAMARRVRMLGAQDLGADLARLRVPTLVVTGEDTLDRVVPVRLTREYLKLWPHARLETIVRTGHLGIITKPHAFADVVAPFVASSARPDVRRRVG